MIANFRDFMRQVIVEELHPELQSIIQSTGNHRTKQSLLAASIRNLTKKGEKTGIESGMPKGSSRAYLQHDEKHPIHIDGKPANIKVGTKVAITAALDKHHNKYKYGGLGLGAMQNEAENADHYVNRRYRVLTHDNENPGHYHTNNEHGIFPPLIDHDDNNHEWSKVGHSRDIGPGEFEEITKTATHPKGISHRHFVAALTRDYDRNNGRYWEQSPAIEKKLDHVESHPLVQKFLEHQHDFGAPPHDYQQKKNLGVWEHPHTGEKSIVARDAGFSNSVSNAYHDARVKAWRA